MLFQQSSAPAGWTKDTSLNNRALRLVSGTVGNGGSTSFADAFNANRVTSGGTVSNHTLTTAQLPAHFHNVWTRNETAIDGSRGNSNANTADHYWYSAGSGYRQVHIGGNHYAPTSSNTGSGQSHNHGFTNPNFNLNVAYTDVIIAQKN
jgi:microcystin-dependent protein